MILSTAIQCFKDWQSNRSQVDEQERCERKNKDGSSGSEGRVCHQLMDGSFLSFLRSYLLSRNELRSLTYDSSSELRFPTSDICFTNSLIHQFINSSIHQKPVACGPSPSSEAIHSSYLCFLTSDLHAQTPVLDPTPMSEVRSQISDIREIEHSTEVPEGYEEARFGCPLLNPQLSAQRHLRSLDPAINRREYARYPFMPQDLTSELWPQTFDSSSELRFPRFDIPFTPSTLHSFTSSPINIRRGKGELPQHPGSDLRHLPPDILFQTSNIRYPTTDFGSPSSVSPLISERIERIERFRLILDREGNKIRVSLEPDGIGRVEISLSAQKGLINGHINVQDPLSKEVIARNIHTLSEMLQKEGINIGNLTVDLNGKNRYKDREDLRDQQVSRINMGPLKGVVCEDSSSNFTFATKQNRPASGLINLFA